MVVTDFLSEHFKDVMDYNFTASVEKEFDEIAEGKLEWAKMINSFYSPFHVSTQKSIEDGERNTGERVLGTDPKTGKVVSARIGRFGPIIQLGEKDDSPVYASLPKDQHIENLTLEDALALLNNEQGGRLLGTDPETGKNVYARVGRFGPMVQLGETNDNPKPKYAALLKGQTVETITLTQALKLFELPRDLGEYEGKKVTVAVGRFGPFISHNSKFVSLKKTDNPVTITMERAIELILEKAESDKKKLIKEFSADFKIVRDRWNHPVIYYKKKYYKLATGVDAEKLTQDDCMKIIGAEPQEKTAEKKPAKKASTKKSSTKK
jgi:DNA topoisomerase-1